MKPELKAKQLVELYLNKIIELAYAETKSLELAKESALLCIEEINLYRKQLEKEYDEDFYHYNDYEEYWEKVKESIKLI